jgi:hypothetical protein
MSEKLFIFLWLLVVLAAVAVAAFLAWLIWINPVILVWIARACIAMAALLFLRGLVVRPDQVRR